MIIIIKLILKQNIYLLTFTALNEHVGCLNVVDRKVDAHAGGTHSKWVEIYTLIKC